MKFKDYVAHYVTTYVDTRSERTGKKAKVQILAAHLLPQFGDMELETITRRVGHDFQAKLKTRDSKRGGKLSNKTINNIMALLHHVLLTAYDDEELGKQPSKFKALKVVQKSPPRLTVDELKKFMTADTDPMFSRMFMLAGLTGMRYGELVALNWKNVDFERNCIHVCQSSPGHSREVFNQTKNGKGHIAPMNAAAKDLLKSFHRSAGLVFEDPRSPSLTISYSRCNAAIRAAGERVGLPHIRFHLLRHTFISIMVADAQVSVGLVRFFVGHSDIRVTQRYIGRDENRDSAAMAQFDALLANPTESLLSS